MGILKRIFGICDTKPPKDPKCWWFEDGKAIVDLSRARELSAGGGAIRLEDRGLPKRILVHRGADGEFRAYENICTHMGRRIDPLVAQLATISAGRDID